MDASRRFVSSLLGLLCLSSFLAGASEPAGETPKRLADGIQDNSFFVEEAYNQGPGVVQHIFNFVGSLDRVHGPDDRSLATSLTEEWPLGCLEHQFSYTIPYLVERSDRRTQDGLGDVLLNYRYQLFAETAAQPAVAPRLSLVLPTGDADRGFGQGRLGYQFNLPVSKVVSNRWSLHANAGLTFFPQVKGRDLTSYTLAASAIYAVTSDFNLMLEMVGSWDEDLAERGKDRSFSALVSPGFRYALNLANDVQVVVGLAAPIGLTGAAPDYGLFVYFSVEHYFLRPRELASAK